MRRGVALESGTRTSQRGRERAGDIEKLYDIVDALQHVAEDVGRTVSQVAINWLLTRPTVSSVVIGARTETQLRENLEAVAWTLRPEHIATLDAVSERRPIYPYWHQRLNTRLNTPPVRVYG